MGTADSELTHMSFSLLARNQLLAQDARRWVWRPHSYGDAMTTTSRTVKWMSFVFHLLVTPVLFLWWQVQMSPVKNTHACSLTWKPKWNGAMIIVINPISCCILSCVLSVSGNTFLPVPVVFLSSKQPTIPTFLVLSLYCIVLLKMPSTSPGPPTQLLSQNFPNQTVRVNTDIAWLTALSFTCSFCCTCESWATHTIQFLFRADILTYHSTESLCVINNTYI